MAIGFAGAATTAFEATAGFGAATGAFGATAAFGAATAAFGAATAAFVAAAGFEQAAERRLNEMASQSSVDDALAELKRKLGK